MHERLDHGRTGCDKGVTVLAENFTSGLKCAKNNWSDLVLEFFSKTPGGFVLNCIKWPKMEFFDLDFPGACPLLTEVK